MNLLTIIDKMYNVIFIFVCKSHRFSQVNLKERPDFS